MDTAVSIAFSLAVIAYSVATTLYFFRLAPQTSERVRRSSWPGRILLLAVILHGFHICAASILTQLCPVASLQFALSLAGWVAVMTFLLMARRAKVEALGAFVSPLALTFLTASQFLEGQGVRPSISRAMLAAHISSNLLGLGFVLLGSAAAAFYLLVDQLLRQKKLGSLGRFPSLGALDRTSSQLLLLSMPFLTLGAVTGGMFFTQIGAGSPAMILRAVFGYIAWAIVTVVLILRALSVGSIKRWAQGTVVAGFAVLAILALYFFRAMGGAGA
ncbi:MAG: cytochrome c biogenesis protein CcsA [Polyangiaceae bacterium]|nr:cytochrome c biogenesis protein CcsA [Polyangiaceae bacterium]